MGFFHNEGEGEGELVIMGRALVIMEERRTCHNVTLPRRPLFYQNYLAMRNTADVGGKTIVIRLQSNSGASAINPLVAFYDIHGSTRGAILLFC
jgi:hypothetical protein